MSWYEWAALPLVYALAGAAWLYGRGLDRRLALQAAALRRREMVLLAKGLIIEDREARVKRGLRSVDPAEQAAARREAADLFRRWLLRPARLSRSPG